MSATIGRYEIIEELGTGGMATVYRAHDPRFGREVAVKVMSADFAHNPTFARRFEREARTIATLEHPAITPVHDFGEHEGRPFLVMRYMSGGSLLNRIRRGPLGLEESVHVLDRIAGALDWAHNQGIIHRDIKPANILYDQHDLPCLADFGIVKLTESTAHLTGSGIVGTPSYMAPEMMEEGRLTHLIDVYALGVTLYEMLARQRPYKSDTPVGLMMAHAVKPVPDIRQVRPDLTSAIQGVIERGMAKDPVDRFQSAGALAAAFHEALRDSAQPAEPVIDRPGVPPIVQEPATSPAGPDAPTMDIDEDTASPPARVVPLPEPAPLPDKTRRSSIPWPWIGGIGVVVVIGIIGLIGLLRGGVALPAAKEPNQTEEIETAEEASEPAVTIEDEEAPVRAATGTLAEVQARGVLKCGVNAELPGFGVIDADGNNVGFDVSFCQAIAAAVFSDANAVEYIALNADQRFPALQTGEVDVLIRNTTWTFTRDTDLGLDFAAINFYDGQGFMVRTGEFESIEELEGGTICVTSSTTTEANLADDFAVRGINYTPNVYSANIDRHEAFVSGACDAETTDKSLLASLRSAEPNPDNYTILPDTISKEPLGLLVREGDSQWRDVVAWTVYAMIQADEFGIGQANVDDMLDSVNPGVYRLLGSGEDNLGAPLGLDQDWAYQVIKQVGSYDDVYDRWLTPIGIVREGGVNAQWIDGGLLYAPVFR